MDTPQPQLRTIVVPADPLPKVFATVEPFLEDETSYRAPAAVSVIDPTTGLPIPQNVKFVTETGDFMTLIPIGAPDGLDANAIMPLSGALHFGDPLPVTSVIGNVLGVVSVTCSAPHGLIDNSQIAALEMSDQKADGFFSVTILSADAFSYQPVERPKIGSLLTDSTIIVTAKVGLPRGYPQIPLV